MPAWGASYIGIPFLERGRTRAGLDCWGMCVVVYREQFGIELPSYADDYDTTKDAGTIARLIREGVQAWRPVLGDAVELGDIVVLRVAGLPWHVGVMLTEDDFLHVDRALGVVRERRSSPSWHRRIVTIVRHPALVPA